MIDLILGDITKSNVEAIVNAANTSLLGGSGVDGAIHRAGGIEISLQCQTIRDRQGGCKVGQAVITTAGNLPSRFIIHAVGPVWQGGSKNEEALLALTYTNSLKLAEKNKIKSIAFPNISTGIYKFPKKRAAEIAIHSARTYLLHSNYIENILFVCFEKENYLIYRDILSQ
jgi:O-acetyl-ADP-ribose deacetylase (regulator of RNase III)